MTIVRYGTIAVILAALAWPAAQARQTDEEPERADIWDVKIGMSITDITALDFIDVACGTNGGPPSLPLGGFEDYAMCRAEPSGLHEVHFAYDDEIEYWARAHEYNTWIERYAGTKLHDQPVVLSVLVDEDGIVRGIRIVTDQRADVRTRRTAAALERRLTSRFGDDWNCEDLPAAEGETPIANVFIKKRCTKEHRDEVRLLVESHYYHKPGQRAFDPHTGEPQPGYFESSTRFEMYDIALPTM